MTTKNPKNEALTQYIGVLDELLARAEELRGLAEAMNRVAHVALADRIQQALNAEVYSIVFTTEHAGLFKASEERRMLVARVSSWLDALEHGLEELAPLASDDDEDDDDADDEGGE
jgi:hypothetical protein